MPSRSASPAVPCTEGGRAASGLCTLDFALTRSSIDTLDLAIVGGGAAGLAAAIFAAGRLPGRRIALLDSARRLGAKILVSGGGRCNVTNRAVRASDYWGGDRRVIASVLRAFSSDDSARFFDTLGVPLHEEPDGKLFPDSNQSRTVLEALLGEVARLGIDVLAGCRVQGVDAGQGTRFALRTTTGLLEARCVLLATGGLSLPRSGSDGGGLAIARALGHSVVPTTPALAPLVLAGGFHVPLSGISHDASLTIAADGGRPERLRGSLLWTHFGASGPLALDASRHWHRAAAGGRAVTARLSFLPDLDFATAESRLIETASARPSAAIRTVLAEWLPAAVATALIDASRLDPATRLAHLARDDRRTLVHALVSLDLPVTGSRGYNYAEATAGGVALGEVDRGTMASKICPGLFFAGEMLDVDGRLGGFNFQWAWSSAFVAARGVADAVTRRRMSMGNEE
jgi:predicted Rossmann fold flavoprotein